MEKKLAELIDRNKAQCARGAVATYIPGLERVNKELLGITVADASGAQASAGDTQLWFTAQSISKLFVLAYLLHLGMDEKLADKTGLEPTGDAFNSLKQLDLDRSDNKPFNPMINAGAISTTSLIPGGTAAEKFAGLLSFVGKTLELEHPRIDEEIFQGERETGNKNWAIAYMLKANKLISADLDETMELYFKQCSLLVRCTDLANFGLFLLREGKLRNGDALISPKQCRLLKGVMFSCGLYNGSGTFAAKVGIPAKTGVSGGVLAVSKHYGIGVYGPALDIHGNSLAGLDLLEDFVDTFSESIL